MAVESEHIVTGGPRSDQIPGDDDNRIATLSGSNIEYYAILCLMPTIIIVTLGFAVASAMKICSPLIPIASLAFIHVIWAIRNYYVEKQETKNPKEKGTHNTCTHTPCTRPNHTRTHTHRPVHVWPDICRVRYGSDAFWFVLRSWTDFCPGRNFFGNIWLSCLFMRHHS